MHIISQCMKSLCEPDGDDINLFLMEIFHSIQNSLYFEIWINNFPFFSWNRHWMTRNCRGEVLLHTVNQIKSIRNFLIFIPLFGYTLSLKIWIINFLLYGVDFTKSFEWKLSIWTSNVTPFGTNMVHCVVSTDEIAIWQ